MTDAAVLLSQLRSLGVEVFAEDGRLRVSAARGRLTPELKEAIASKKVELLAALSTREGGVAAEAASVPRTPRGDRLPLSLFQERLWIQSRFTPGGTDYNMTAAFASDGPVETSRVVEAIRELVRRHASLRASFHDDEGVPFVTLLDPVDVPITVRDLGGGTEEAHAAEISADAERATHTPFDLGRQAPVRFLVYRAAGGRVVTVVSAHHIAMDAWSFALLGRDILAAYQGRPLGPPPALDYVDFAAWQRGALAGGALAADVDWWARRLARAPKTSTIPADRSGVSPGGGATRSFEFSQELSAGIRALAREEKATAYMVLVAACAAVVRWRTGQDDVVVGSPMGLRERPEFESVVGPFVNLLALRLELSGDPGFAELLARTRAVVLDAHEHRHVPFEKIVERVNPERSVSHAPLFQVAVVQHNATGGGLRIESGGALFDLTWFVREENGSFMGGLEYRSDRYRPETIDAVAAKLEEVLRRAVEDRRTRLSEVARSPEGDAPGSARPPGARVDSAADYFRARLEGAPAIELAADRPRTLRRPPAPASRTTPLSRAWIHAVRACARERGTSPLVVSLAAMHALLSRYTSQDDVTVGIPPAGAGAEGATWALPIRATVRLDAPFDAHLARVGSAVDEAFAGRESPDELRAALDRVRAETGAPAASVLLAFGEAAAWSDRRPGGAGAAGPEGTADLCISIADAPDGLALTIEYDAALFDPETIDQLLRSYGALLAEAASSPATPVAQLPLLTPADRAELLARSTGSSGAACATPVIELFARQAAATADAIAVADATERLSYRALDRAANALASRLRGAGVGPGHRVAVSLERSAAVVVSLLAILRTGAAYVPVDPHYPPERSAFVVEDAAPVVLLTEERLRDRLRLPAGVSLVCVDPGAVVHEEADPPGAPPGDPDAVAYVLYTSGSTGRPKGVEIPNRALTNFLVSMQRTPGLKASDRLLSVTTISFDIAALEIFLPLVTGACVEIAPRDVIADGARLATLIERSGATVMQATPSTWRLLIEAGWRGDPRLELLCGGEAMPRELAKQLVARAGAVWNMYGPTETTVWSTVQRVDAGEGRVPIGAPIDNTRVYVLDPRGEILPYGVPGELFIGGAGVARGYLGRPELTAARFVADPFAGGAARMYRTGDAARLRHDGTLEYLGRLDHQVKIRGHRIELGEIESVVREHPGVAGAAVVARETRPGDVRLVAYYVPHGTAVAPRDLRELCQRKLPREVVPTAWVAVPAIPLTPNGKTDTKALPPPDAIALGEGAEHVAPRDALEQQVAAIWESVLGAKGLSVRDKFFDVGGHSLLAIRLFGRVEQATGVALPLASLVEEGTIEQMASAIRDRRGPNVAASPEEAAPHLVRIRAHGSRPPLFCVHGAGGNVLNFRDIARHIAPDRPFYGIQAAGVDGTTQPMTSIEAMADKYLAELRVVQPHGPYYLSGYCGGGLVSYEIAQRLVAAGERVASLVLIDLHRPGVIVLESRARRWARTLLGATPSKIAERLRVKFDRDLDDAMCALRLRYHLMRGSRVPFELREYWLNDCFLRAMADYRVVPYPGKLTILRAREINEFYGDPGPDLGWAPYARGGIDAHDVPGNHHTMTLEPNVQELAGKLERCLRAAEDAAGSGLPIDPSSRGVAA